MSKTCFFVCPLGDIESDIRRHTNDVYELIVKKACEATGYEAIRADLVPHAGDITKLIIDYLETAELVIADLTGHNPNVFYEVGYRAAIKQPLLVMAQESTKLPFDISHKNTLFYEMDVRSADNARLQLEEIIKSIEMEQGQSIVEKLDNITKQMSYLLTQMNDQPRFMIQDRSGNVTPARTIIGVRK